MATHAPRSADFELDLVVEGPEFDALIKSKVAEADADPRPSIPMKEVFEGLRKRHLKRVTRGV